MRHKYIFHSIFFSCCDDYFYEMLQSANKLFIFETTTQYEHQIGREQTRYYLPTPPLGQDMTQGQFLSGV